MQDQVQLRLELLKKEFEVGQVRLQETDRQQSALRETLLRISGAIQILEELHASAEQQPAEIALSAAAGHISSVGSVS